MRAARRHLLVLAPQCQAKPPLDQLGDAARELERVLTDSQIGGCAPGLPDGRSLFSGKLSRNDLRARVEEAVRHARDKEATLILALLGHGFRPGDAPVLYLMADDSDEADPMSAVDVGSLLCEAANTPQINGVIGIVDTCFALNAQPRVQELASGLREGRTRLSLLMASSATQEAIDLRFSRALTELLKHGLDGKGPRLEIRDVLYELRQRVTGQVIPGLEYDADPSAELPLWLARNVRHDDEWPEGLIGPKGRQELEAAWRTLHPDSPSYDGPWDDHALRALRRELAPDDGSDERKRAQRAAKDADLAQSTVRLLRLLMDRPIEITRASLHQALAMLWTEKEWLSPVPAQPDEVEAVDHVAFCHPDRVDDCREWMTMFVWLVASAAGVHKDDDDLRDWVRGAKAQLYLSEAFESVRKMRGRRALRLVILLVSLTDDWPKSLKAWLYLNGKQYGDSESVDCQTVNKVGTNEALRKVLSWAKDRAEDLGFAEGPERVDEGLGPTLRQVDIIAPAKVLLEWQPEIVEVGRIHEYLGRRHDVLTHWSRRVEPDVDWSMREGAGSQPQNGSDARVKWFTEPRAREHASLREWLKKARLPMAAGLVNHPGTDAELITLVLEHFPILLWPQAGASFPAELHDYINACWGLLPGGLHSAYRKRWDGDDADALADVRAVWDDQEWLVFSRRFRR